MNIIVCIKQVPDVKEVSWDPETGNLIRTGLPSIINPNDKNAIEAALRLREAHGGEITVISMGPPQVEESLREALGMGLNKAVMISDRKFAGADCWATTYTLARAIQKIGEWDLIMTGVEAMDGNTAQVGPELADCLGVPLLSYALDVKAEDGKIMITQNLGEAVRELEAPQPALVTVDREANEPRVAPMDCVMEAYEKDIPGWGADDLDGEEENFGIKGSPTRLRKVFSPKVVKGQAEVLGGSPEEAAAALLTKLKEKHLI